MSSVTSTTALVFSMPVPGMADAPKFTGHQPSAFLQQIVAHGSRAGITNKDQLVDYIVLYLSDEVALNIQYLPEFDLDETGEDVGNSRSAKELKFTKKSELAKYQNSFLKVASPLLKNKMITRTDSNYYFAQGLPTKDPQVPHATSLDTHDWESDHSADEASLEQLNNVKFSRDLKKEDGPSSSKKPILKKEEVKSSDFIESLTKEMQEIKATLANLNRRSSPRPPTPTNTPVDQTPPPAPARPCWLCGEWHKDPTIPGKCPHIKEFINKGLVVRQYNGRITLPDGSQLPRVQDAPPHMSSSSSPAALSYGGRDVFSGNVFGVASADIRFDYDDPEDDEYLYAPTTRSGRDTSSRHDPMTQKDSHQVRKTQFHRHLNYLSLKTLRIRKPWNTKIRLQDLLLDPRRNRLRYQSPPIRLTRMKAGGNPNLPNHKNQWKIGKPKRKRGMGIVEYPPPPHSITLLRTFTSDVLGCSPDLTKQMVEAAKMRREYAQKEVSALYLEDEDEGVEQTVVRGLEVPVEDAPKLQNFLVKYSSAVVAADKLYTMVTGVFNVVINGQKFRAMIDTGSELTIGSRSFFEHARLPLEIEGMKWSLKDVNGGVKPLMGVLTDTDIWIGKYNFPHHIFVSRGELSNSWDIIIGQPFLQYYASRIEYWHSGDTRLFLWNDGDKSRIPHVSIALTDPKSERNQYVIRNPNEDKERPFIEAREYTGYGDWPASGDF
ncbi:hypothetical protein BT96DRAFT_947073 [Gymnopus androsaceus JB14]|uniref:DUF4100 domain-containing protein n=1 Tax=Gymnopus androsaceus JB14 TaxID=1447944 RepID=A0A6A4GV06_9AGAR|nr:hypothetical protein BT96DRAFT_947073 [Gymnopus androsaceus JB14]